MIVITLDLLDDQGTVTNKPFNQADEDWKYQHTKIQKFWSSNKKKERFDPVDNEANIPSVGGYEFQPARDQG